MALEITTEDRSVIEEIFKSKDVDGNGVIDRAELAECLSKLGLDTTPEEREFLEKQFDTNGDGKLQISELMSNLTVLKEHSLNGSSIMDAFRVFDRSEDGHITPAELHRILTAPIPGAMTTEEATEIIDTMLSNGVDEDNDGKFKYSEFIKIWNSDCLVKFF